MDEILLSWMQFEIIILDTVKVVAKLAQRRERSKKIDPIENQLCMDWTTDTINAKKSLFLTLALLLLVVTVSMILSLAGVVHGDFCPR